MEDLHLTTPMTFTEVISDPHFGALLSATYHAHQTATCVFRASKQHYAQTETEEDIRLYLEACFDGAGDDAAFIAKALGNVAKARCMMQLAKDTGLGRESLYTALSTFRLKKCLPIRWSASWESDYVIQSCFLMLWLRFKCWASRD